MAGNRDALYGPFAFESELMGWGCPHAGLADIVLHATSTAPPYRQLVARADDASPVQRLRGQPYTEWQALAGTEPPRWFLATGDNDTQVSTLAPLQGLASPQSPPRRAPPSRCPLHRAPPHTLRPCPRRRRCRTARRSG